MVLAGGYAISAHRAIELRDDARFFGYGLSEADVQELRTWAASWVEDLRWRAAGENLGSSAEVLDGSCGPEYAPVVVQRKGVLVRS